MTSYGLRKVEKFNIEKKIEITRTENSKNVIGTIEGYVWAESYEEAIELIRNKEYEEIERFDIEEVDDIEDIKEE